MFVSKIFDGLSLASADDMTAINDKAFKRVNNVDVIGSSFFAVRG